MCYICVYIIYITDCIFFVYHTEIYFHKMEILRK